MVVLFPPICILHYLRFALWGGEGWGGFPAPCVRPLLGLKKNVASVYPEYSAFIRSSGISIDKGGDLVSCTSGESDDPIGDVRGVCGASRLYLAGNSGESWVVKKCRRAARNLPKCLTMTTFGLEQLWIYFQMGWRS